MLERFLKNGNKRGGSFSPNTIGDYRAALEHFFSFIKKDFRKVTRKECEDFKQHLESKKLNIKSIWHEIVAVKSFYRYAIESDEFKNNSPCYFKVPSKDLKSKQSFIESQILSREEVKKLFEITKSPRDSAVLKILYWCGLRVSELTGLNMKSIDMKKRIMVINGKGDKERVIQFNDDVFHALNLWLIVRGIPETDALFTTKFGNRLDNTYVRDMVKKQCKKIGIERRITPHSFRHTMITHALEDGVSTAEVSAFAGHSSTDITLSYVPIVKLSNNVSSKFQGIYRED
jgi:site-specific recombinase XerD